MGRNCCHPALAFAFVLFSLLSESVLGQDAYSRHWLDLVRSSAPGSAEQLRSKFHLTESLRRHDLDAALSNALDTVDLAKSLSDPPYLAVANADVELTWRMIELTPGESCSLEWSEIAELEPELRHHVCQGILAAELIAGQSTGNIEPWLSSCRESSQALSDPYLLARSLANDLLFRVFYLNESASSPIVIDQVDQLQRQSKTLEFNDGLVIASLVKSLALDYRSQWDEQVEILKRGHDQAAEGENQVLSFKCQRALAIAMLQKKKFDEARGYQEQALQTAEAFGCESLIVKSLHGLSTLELAAGRPAKAAEYRDRVTASANYKNLPLLHRDSLERFSVWIHREMGDEAKAQQIQSQLMDQTLAEELEEYDRRVTRQQEFNNQLAQEKLAQEKSLSEKERSLKAAAELNKKNRLAHQADQTNLRTQYEQALGSVLSTLKFYRYSLLVTVLVLSWMILLQMRSRLRSMSRELDSERVSSERSQLKCDELAIRLNRLQRMESLGLMAGSVAHDFNNILVGVMGNAEIIKMKQDAGPDSQVDPFVSQRISGIIKSAEKAAGLSRQMLAYAGKQQIERQRVDLNQLILQYRSVLESACKTGQTHDFQLSPQPVFSKIDVTQIEQVVLNLVTNAVEASGSDAQIRIATGFDRIIEIEDDCSLYGTRETGGDFCFVEVADFGCGISQLDMERIFEPFFTSSDLGKGLGLSVVYGVITGHDGFVKCSSQVGVGTSFKVLLPLAKEADLNLPDHGELDSDHRMGSDPSIPTSDTRKILVVDDEETVLELCSQSLEFHGWEVVTAVGGADGLELVAGRNHEFACILVDVVMPEMGASEFLRELERRGIELPVVVMSGFSQTRLEFFLERPNVVAIVEKPFRLNQIKSAIQTAIDNGNRPRCVATGRNIQNHADSVDEVPS